MLHNLTNEAIIELFGNSKFTFLGQLKEKSTHGDGKSACLLGGMSETSRPLKEPQKKRKNIVDL